MQHLSRLHPLAQIGLLAVYAVFVVLILTGAALTLVAFSPAWGAK